MGEIGSVTSLLSRGHSAMAPELLAVLNPSPEDRNRSELIKNADFGLPSVASWRQAPTVGSALTGHRIVSNHFLLNVNDVAGPIYHYHVHIYRVDRDNATVIRSVDCAVEDDPQVNTTLLRKLSTDVMHWGAGITYDGRSALFSSTQLHGDNDTETKEFISEVVPLVKTDGTDSTKRYLITLTFIEKVVMPSTTNPTEWGRLAPQTVLRALDTPILMSARWEQQVDDPSWLLVGSKAFPRNGQMSQINESYVALRGYYAALKTCMAGLVLVCDMSVSCFLTGGPMLEVMCHAGGFNNVRDMADTAYQRRGFPSQVIAKINDIIKGTRIILTHLKQRRKAKCLGPPANSEDSRFEDSSGKRLTVAEYFEAQYKKLKYPELPTINVGSAKKPILFPPEVVMVPHGQCRAQRMTGDMTASMIRYAAVRPNDRQSFITGTESIVHVVRNDPIAAAFGVGHVSQAPIVTPATLLPPARIRYGNGAEVDPVLAGSWNLNRNKFVTPPPNAGPDGKYMYGVMIVSDREPQNWREPVDRFVQDLERDARDCGLQLRSGGSTMSSSSLPDEMAAKLSMMMKHGARIVIVMLVTDAYNALKLEADRIGLPTQCLRWKNVERPPRGYHSNVMLKINTKLGGCNHTLVSRLPRDAPREAVFQDPPVSLCWVMDKPCMLVGIDVSHAEPGSNRESTAAVVGSMNGQASQYVAHISTQAARTEMVTQLTDAMMCLMSTFKKNNNVMPEHIVVFRDGVSDGQFEQVLQTEVRAVRDAMELSGYTEDHIKLAYVICQKGHHTRLVYEDSSEFINLCPGVVLDSSGGPSSITSSKFNEFYLNSHVSIQGTSKPCKYALLYDSIGIKMAELELLTYWSTYLYARCNRSVSIATPAYYAHWACRRAKNLAVAGASNNDLQNISQIWAEGRKASMFFI